MGVQIHGGMGFIEETGAAQHYRDARIAPIYEGTNGIQAMDLVGRKLSMDGGQAAHDLIKDMKTTAAELSRLYSGKPVERFATAIEASRFSEPAASVRRKVASSASAYCEMRA